MYRLPPGPASGFLHFFDGPGGKPVEKFSAPWFGCAAGSGRCAGRPEHADTGGRPDARRPISARFQAVPEDSLLRATLRVDRQGRSLTVQRTKLLIDAQDRASFMIEGRSVEGRRH